MDTRHVWTRLCMVLTIGFAVALIACSCGSRKTTYMIVVKNGEMEKLTDVMLFFTDRQYAQEIGEMEPGAKTDPTPCEEGVPENVEVRWMTTDGTIVTKKVRVLDTVTKKPKGKVEFRIENGDVSVKVIGLD